MQSVRRVLRVLAALASALCLGATGAQAQDATTTVVQAAARDWLAQADKGDTTATYDAAGEQFRTAMTRAGWSEALASVRKPLGAMQRRTMAATTFRTSAPGAPAADFALVRFRTEFAQKADARETVTLQREADGRWRVVGYKLQ